MVEIGIYTAHLAIYQPETRGEEMFCEDLPDLGATLFVLDYLHGSLREVPVDFRVLRDADELGMFARWEHVAALAPADLEERTVFYQPPAVRPENQLQAEFPFLEGGAYLGVVSAPHPSKRIRYRAVFPFRVGARDWLPWLLAAAAAAAALYRFGRSRA